MPKPRRSFKGEPPDLRAAPADRYAAGRARLEAVPLEAHAEAAAGAGRADPLTVLVEQEKTRLSELIPLRYGRMSRTPFTFLRGSAAIMASDLAAGARTDLQVELCGDAHLGNFRWYSAPTRDLVFDLNDFDETLPGPFEWDVKRLAASITVAGRASGLTKQQARRATRSAMRDYRKSIAETAARNPLDLHYYRFESRGALERIGTRGKTPFVAAVEIDAAGLRACPDRHERPGHRPTSPGAQLGRHHARQRQERHLRHLLCDPSQASAALPGRIQLSLQSTLRSGQHASTAGHRRRTNTPDALSARNVG
jgi:hypothetical protein